MLVANPMATRVTPRTRDLIAHAFASVARLEVAWTEGPGHATKLATDAARAGLDLVVALGGDGTVNEVAQGLAGTDTAFAVVPGGGTDVFARTLGLPNETIEAAEIVIERIEAHTAPVARGIGRVALGPDASEPWPSRVFCFNAGLGYDAAIVEAVDRRPRRKERFGEAYFATQALKVFFAGYPRRSVQVTVETDDGRLATGRLAVCCLSSPYTFLGRRGLRLCPDASPDRGIDILVVRDLTLVRTLRTAMRAFGRARHGRLRGVTILEGVRGATVTADRALPVHTDGELGPHTQTAMLRFEPSALRLLS